MSASQTTFFLFSQECSVKMLVPVLRPRMLKGVRITMMRKKIKIVLKSYYLSIRFVICLHVYMHSTRSQLFLYLTWTSVGIRLNLGMSTYHLVGIQKVKFVDQFNFDLRMANRLYNSVRYIFATLMSAPVDNFWIMLRFTSMSQSALVIKGLNQYQDSRNRKESSGIF